MLIIITASYNPGFSLDRNTFRNNICSSTVERTKPRDGSALFVINYLPPKNIYENILDSIQVKSDRYFIYINYQITIVWVTQAKRHTLANSAERRLLSSNLITNIYFITGYLLFSCNYFY